MQPVARSKQIRRPLVPSTLRPAMRMPAASRAWTTAWTLLSPIVRHAPLPNMRAPPTSLAVTSRLSTPWLLSVETMWGMAVSANLAGLSPPFDWGSTTWLSMPSRRRGEYSVTATQEPTIVVRRLGAAAQTAWPIPTATSLSLERIEQKHAAPGCCVKAVRVHSGLRKAFSIAVRRASEGTNNSHQFNSSPSW